MAISCVLAKSSSASNALPEKMGELWPQNSWSPSGQGSGRQTILSGDAVVIGRSSAAQVVVDDAQVSRRHAECKLQAGQWFIHDLGSANGTFVNGRRLGADEMLPLRPGDRLRLGKNVELSFENTNEAAPFVGFGRTA